MDTHSDISVLFSRLNRDPKQYQEIGRSHQKLREISSRWILLHEVHASLSHVKHEALDRA